MPDGPRGIGGEGGPGGSIGGGDGGPPLDDPARPGAVLPAHDPVQHR